MVATDSTILITGTAGFVGSHLSRRLREIGSRRIIGIGRRNRIADPNLGEYICCDLRNGETLRSVIRHFRPAQVFHLAGQTRGETGELYSNNVLGTVLLMEALCEFSKRTELLVAGSAAEYGPVDAESLPITEDERCRPVGAYGISKH